MTIGRTSLTATLAFALAACGGDGSAPAIAGGGGGGGNPTPTPTACSLSEQIDFGDAVLDQWYLFPNLLDNTVNRANFTTLQGFLDARVAPARAQSVDRFFTFATSIAEENALISSGSSAGFGIRLAYNTTENRVFILEAFEAGNGFAAGLDRGAELLGIGTNASNIQTVTSLMTSGGAQAVVDALGPSDAGVTRVLRFETAGGVITEASVTKSDFSLDPISDRYGAVVLDNGGTKVAYINLRTFIVQDASDQLRAAFATFGAEGITEFIIDFRYNGGGLVNVADTFGDLLGAGRVGQVWSETVFRASQSQENSTRRFENEANAIQPTKIAFIGRGGTASASELVINSMIPYLGNNMALIGEDTFGKPVGQSGFDLADCDLRVRAVTFQTNNADGNGEYYTGLADSVANTCAADDDFTKPLGDPTEASIATALDFLAGRACTAIGAAPTPNVATSDTMPQTQLLQPIRPNATQIDVPGSY
jgi:C-terminal processing protease CtpA/Prc